MIRHLLRLVWNRKRANALIVAEIFVSFLVIFVAELGDKSQLVALWFAARYRWWLVLVGVTAATLVVHFGSFSLPGGLWGQSASRSRA